jgi:sortase A
MGYNSNVRKVRSPEDLSVDELHRLLVEKRRKLRQEHIERFKQTGRVVTLASDLPAASLDHLRTGQIIPDTPTGETKPSLLRRILDRSLLLVELLAVAGLIFVLFSGMRILRDLNTQVAEVLVQPTLTPTPIISAVVLPSGHLPPNSPGGYQKNDSEIPEHLRPLVISLAAIPTPTAAPGHPVRIQIPAIGVDAPVVLGDGDEQLKKGVGHHIGSANPGEPGNLVLTAHNDVFGEIFRDLDQLKPGDTVIVYTNGQRIYTYLVTGTEVVGPLDVEVLAPTEQPIVTLISCYPYMVDNKRIVVRGSLQTK